MKLIIFKLTSLEDGWLANDLLFNSVRQVIVDCIWSLEDVYQAIFRIFFSSFISILLSRTFLNEHFGAKLF